MAEEDIGPWFVEGFKPSGGQKPAPPKPTQGTGNASNSRSVKQKTGFDELKYGPASSGFGVEVTGIGTCKKTKIAISPKHGDKPVVGVGKNAFENCTQITDLEIPAGITYIGNSAFAHCSSLRRITFPDGSLSIGEHAFYMCKSLDEVFVYSAPKQNAFEGASARVYVYSKNQPTTEGLFWHYEGRERKIWPPVSKSVKKSAVQKAVPKPSTPSKPKTTPPKKGLVSPQAVKEPSPSKGLEYRKILGGCVVAGIGSCTDRRIIIPSENEEGRPVIKIRKYAFYDVSGIESVCLSDSVRSIEEGAFENSSVKSVTMSKNLNEIGPYAFKDSSVTGMTIPKGVTSIKTGTFFHCESLSSIGLSGSINTIGAEAFKNCSALVAVDIPGSVSVIESRAFDGCTSLSRVSISKNLTEIKRYAFNNCHALRNVVYRGGNKRDFQNIKNAGGNTSFTTAKIKYE